MTDVNVSYDSEDNIRNDSNAGKVIRPVERQGSSVEGPPPPPPPPLQPAVVVPNLELRIISDRLEAALRSLRDRLKLHAECSWRALGARARLETS